MSTKETLFNEKFPKKPHNCKKSRVDTLGLRLTGSYVAPAVKVPGLVFCSGQVGFGDIKTATVSRIPIPSDVGAEFLGVA